MLQRDQVREQGVVRHLIIARPHTLQLRLQLRDLVTHPDLLETGEHRVGVSARVRRMNFFDRELRDEVSAGHIDHFCGDIRDPRWAGTL